MFKNILESKSLRKSSAFYRKAFQQRKKNWKTRLLIIGLALASQYLIQFSAITYVKDLYEPYKPYPITALKILISSLLTVIPAILLPLKNTPAPSAAWVYYTLIYLSATSIGITVTDSFFSYTFYIFFLLGGMIIMLLVGNYKKYIKTRKIKIKNLDKLYLLFAIILVGFSWSLSGFNPQLGINDVYERRIEAFHSNRFAGYFLAPLRLLFPLLAVYALISKRNIIWLLLVAAGIFGVFSYDGTKSSIFYLLALAVIVVGIKQNCLPIWLLGCIVATNLIALLENIFSGNALIFDYIVRRAFVLPGWISSFYWSFNTNSTRLENITYQIGYALFGDETSNANTNFMMWGWIWAKWLGGLLVAICAGAIIWVFNYVPEKRFPYLGSLMAAGTVLIWAEQFLHTSMLSSGVSMVVLTALLFRYAQDGWDTFFRKKKS